MEVGDGDAPVELDAEAEVEAETEGRKILEGAGEASSRRMTSSKS